MTDTNETDKTRPEAAESSGNEPVSGDQDNQGKEALQDTPPELPDPEKLSPAERDALLEELNEKKEAAFREKQQIGTKIAEKIKKIGQLKKRRDELTAEVRGLKKERDALNNQITEQISEVKKVRPQKQVDLPKDEKGRPLRPRFLQKQIKALEQKIETVPMDFNAEQRVMKQIKTLRKQLEESEEAMGMSTEVAEKSRKIDEFKRAANALHAKVTDLAKESQQYHEEMLQIGNEIDELKKKEDEEFNTFAKYKEQYVKLAGNVKAEQAEQRRVKAKRQTLAKKKREEAEKKSLKERAQEAEDKMSKGKKLTTEDLLALQGIE